MHSSSARQRIFADRPNRSANARTWANGTPPGTATAMPSAIVDIDAAHTGFPAAKEPGQAAAFGPAFSITRTCGARK